MFTNLSKITGLLLISIIIVVTGCGNNAKNEIKQQSTSMQQATNKLEMNVENQFDVAKQAAARVARLTGVKQANVLVTKHNAYVAAVVNTPENQLPRTLENHIAKAVRTADPTIQNVYVSTNPEFVDRVNQYVENVRQGRPISGFIDELGTMIQRIFPVSR